MKNRMSLDDVVAELRDRGFPIGKKTLADMIESGQLPFGSVVSSGATGRRTFLILRSDFEAWADQKLK